VALKVNWPFLRDAGSLGSQIIEPIVQVIAAPNTGNSLRDHIPNEDALNYEFTDATLFSLNRFGGYDRFDGGTRANAALHANWTFPGGSAIDGLVGASWQQHIDRNLYPQFQPWNGFETGKHVSDIVGRISFTPNPWVDFTARGRVDQHTGDIPFADAVASFGKPILHVSTGYFYGATDPFPLYTFFPNYLTPNFLTQANPAAASFFIPRSEAELAVSTHFRHWTLSTNARRNLTTGGLDSIGAEGKYEDECTIFDILFSRRYTSINNDHGDTTLLFTIALKTVGQIGFNGS
jgi:LPS-assembly protein